jgi:hypothetical protein
MVKLWFAPCCTVCAVDGLINPPFPADGVTVHIWMLAEQLAVDPPFDPVQLHVHPVDVGVTVDAMPALHRLILGTDVNVPPLDDPQDPFTGPVVNDAETVQSAAIAFVV